MRALALLGIIGSILAPSFAGSALAQQSGRAKSMQQQIMQECSAEATAKKLEGSALKQAIDECTRSRSESSPQQVKQQKTALCQRRATQNGVKGHDRQHFVEDCVAAPGEMAEHHEKMFQCSRRATQERVFDAARPSYMDKCMMKN